MSWLPRILLIAFALFLVIFSFDTFEEGRSAGEIAVAFTLHNVPTLGLLALVALAWRHEWLGALACLLLAALYLVWASARLPLPAQAAIAGPMFVVATLYAFAWRRRRQG